jgi:hypothetical protein
MIMTAALDINNAYTQALNATSLDILPPAPHGSYRTDRISFFSKQPARLV